MQQMGEEHVLTATNLNHHAVLTKDASDVWKKHSQSLSTTAVKSVRVRPVIWFC
jgi:hypothetical protein